MHPTWNNLFTFILAMCLTLLYTQARPRLSHGWSNTTTALPPIVENITVAEPSVVEEVTTGGPWCRSWVAKGTLVVGVVGVAVVQPQGLGPLLVRFMEVRREQHR